MASPTLYLDPDEVFVVSGDGGFLIAAAREGEAVEIFRAWHRHASRRFWRQVWADSRRRAFRVVPLPI